MYGGILGCRAEKWVRNVFLARILGWRRRDIRIPAEARGGGKTHCFPFVMASPIVLWYFRRAISTSSSAIVASWIKTVESKPALVRLGVGWVSPENLN